MTPRERAALVEVARAWFHKPGFPVDFDDLADMIDERFEVTER